MAERAMSVTRACGLVGISRSLFHYESQRRIDDEELTSRMMTIAAQKRRYGYRRIHVLLKREAGLANHKRIWRLYSKAGLSARKRRRKRIAGQSCKGASRQAPQHCRKSILEGAAPNGPDGPS